MPTALVTPSSRSKNLSLSPSTLRRRSVLVLRGEKVEAKGLSGFTSRIQHSDISGHLLQNSILIPFIYLTGQFNVLNFPTCNTETTRHCQPGLYTHFCVKGNNLSFFIFYVFLGLVIVTTVKPVLNGPCIKWNLS